MESLELYLVARDVGPDADPLADAIAVAHAMPAGPGLREWNTRLTDVARALLSPMTGGGDDAKADHLIMPRYELVRGRGDRLCAFAVLDVAPDGSRMRVTSPDWLAGSAASGALAAVGAIVRAAHDGEGASRG